MAEREPRPLRSTPTTSTRSSHSSWWIDSVRRGLYRALRPWLGAFYADRARRVTWMGVSSVCLSFALTLVAPVALLTLGPVLLGLPHLLSGARYLVVQPRLHQRGPVLGLAALPLLATGFGAPAAVSLLALVPAVLAARGSAARKRVALLGWLGLSALAVAFEAPFVLAFLHVHNLVAVVWWWVLRPRGVGAWLVPGLVGAGAVFLLLGGAEPVRTALGDLDAARTLGDFIDRSAPFAPDPWGLRLVLSFAFLQSVHYAMWLRLVPEDARARPAPRTFRESWRALERDFGRPSLLVFAPLWLLVGGWGCVDLAEARLGYLRLASFHGYLELAAAALFLVEGRRPAPESDVDQYRTPLLPRAGLPIERPGGGADAESADEPSSGGRKAL